MAGSKYSTDSYLAKDIAFAITAAFLVLGRVLINSLCGDGAMRFKLPNHWRLTMRCDLSDFEWEVIEPLLPQKSRGVPRVDDRRVLSGIFWILRTGAPWRDLPGHYGPYTTCYNRFNRWRKAGIWDDLMNGVKKGYEGDMQMIDSSVVRVHQHGATQKKRQG